MEILLGREEINPDKPDNYGQTPLLYAAKYGREGAVKILLRQAEVNPDRPDNYGQTPLLYATEKGHERVVALIQSRKVMTPTGSTIYGYDTPLHANDHRPFPFSVCYPRRLPLGIILYRLGKSHEIGMQVPSHPPESPQRFSDTVE